MTVTATDSDGDSTTLTFELVVENVAPEADVDQDTIYADEGQTATNTGRAGDVGADVLSATASVGTVTLEPLPGEFGASQLIDGAAGGAYDVYAADVDRDGDLDVVAALRDDDTRGLVRERRHGQLCQARGG